MTNPLQGSDEETRTFKSAMQEQRMILRALLVVVAFFPASQMYFDPWVPTPSVAEIVIADLLAVAVGWALVYGVAALYAWGSVLADRLTEVVSRREASR